MRAITRYLQTTLKLTVNPAKSKVALMSECSFLGFTINGKNIRWTDKALAAFKHRVKELTGRSWGVSMEHRLHKLGQYVRGWTAYFGISQYYRPVPELDDWIRRRIRMCYWKQWRWVRTKIKHLLALGVSLKTAIQHGVSSKRRVGPEGVRWTASCLRAAHGTHPGVAAGAVQRVVESAGPGQRERAVVQASQLLDINCQRLMGVS